MKDYIKRLTNEQIAVGGWKCPCCGPRDSKPQARRRARRNAKQALARAKEV
jgi:hypothetical protein